MSATAEHKCICGHAKETHAFDGGESVCAAQGCKCVKFVLWEVAFFDPSGKMHAATNVHHFVKANLSLFEPFDQESNPSPSDDANYIDRPRAVKQLLGLVENRREQWKGWSVATFPKTYRP